jgi:BirA family biotin operon repressor/biotin-[acetyl-CoA-carboxylase] ligase
MPSPLPEKTPPSQPPALTALMGYIGPEKAPWHQAGPLPSVMDLAWDMIEGQRLSPPWFSVLAESQSRGRGRQGRLWLSPPGHLYAALRLPLAGPFQGSLASLALALYLSEAIEEISGLPILIKWPNDLIWEGKKFGGILLEQKKGALLAGIGLNLGAPPPAHRDPQAPPAGALPENLGPPPKLWPALAERTQIRYNKGLAGPSQNLASKVAKAAQRRLLGLGAVARVEDPATEPPSSGAALSGPVLGLSESGALMIGCPAGPLAVWSGTLILPPNVFQSGPK